MPRRARALADQPEGRALREQLIEVAEGLLAECRPDELTTRRIAREAGVADGVLYNHFENKDELILEALVARTSGLVRAFRDARPVAGTATVEANLERLASALVELQRALIPLLVGLVGRRALLERFLVAVHGTEIGGPDAVLRCVHDYLDAERQLGRLGDGSDTHVAGVLLFAITQLQALVMQFRPTASEGAQDLLPFVHFLAATLTGAAHDPERSGP